MQSVVQLLNRKPSNRKPRALEGRFSDVFFSAIPTFTSNEILINMSTASNKSFVSLP